MCSVGWAASPVLADGGLAGRSGFGCSSPFGAVSGSFCGPAVGGSTGLAGAFGAGFRFRVCGLCPGGRGDLAPGGGQLSGGTFQCGVRWGCGASPPSVRPAGVYVRVGCGSRLSVGLVAGVTWRGVRRGGRVRVFVAFWWCCEVLLWPGPRRFDRIGGVSESSGFRGVTFVGLGSVAGVTWCGVRRSTRCAGGPSAG